MDFRSSILFIFMFGILLKSVKAYDCGNLFNKTTGDVSNNTLHPDSKCSYRIQPVAKKNTTHLVPIRLFLKKLQLDVKDNVSIFSAENDTEPLFIFHGQSAAVFLVTKQSSLFIQIEISSVKNISRHFEAYYDSITQSCLINVPPDVIDIQEPLLENSTDHIDCTISYKNDKCNDQCTHAYSFLVLNLSGASSILAKDIEGPQPSFKGTDRPRDMFSLGGAQFDVKVAKGDHFIIHQDRLLTNCSGFLPLDPGGKRTISSPSWPTLNSESWFTECRWLLSTTGSAFSLNVKSLNLNDTAEVLVLNDGPNFDSSPLYQITSSMTSKALDRVIVTSGTNLMISFNSKSPLSHFQLDIQGLEIGKYVKNSGHLKAAPTSPTSAAIWLLEAEENSTAVLQFSPQLGITDTFSLNIYDDFSLKSKLIATITSPSVWYPIVSTTSRMMIWTNNFARGSFNAEFSSSLAGCMHMSQGTGDSYTLSKNCNTSCGWIIPPMSTNNTDLRLDLQYIALSENDTVEVMNLDNKTVLAKALPNTSHIPQLTINAQKGAFVNIKRGVCSMQPNDSVILVAQANYLPSCSRKIILNVSETKVLTSPNFPNTYPLYSQCQTVLTTLPTKQILHLSFETFQLASNHSLSIKVTGSETPLILKGSVLPNDQIFSNDTILTFNSDSSLASLTSSLGYSLSVTSADCGGIISKNSGSISTVVNKTLCIWKISVLPNTDKDSVNSILFTVKKLDKVENYDLKIFDGPTVKNKTVNMTVNEYWGRTDTIIVMYKLLNVGKPAGQITIDFQSKSCNKSMQCADVPICLHPDWRCNGHDDCGDDTDERQCVPAPTSPLPPPGISSTTFGIVCVLMFIIGFGAVFLIKAMIQKYQDRRYSRFGEVPVIE